MHKDWLVEKDTAAAQDWPGITRHRVLSNGQVQEDTQCKGLGRYMNTQSTQDWPEIRRHTVQRTGQKEEHTEYTRLARNEKTHNNLNHDFNDHPLLLTC